MSQNTLLESCFALTEQDRQIVAGAAMAGDTPLGRAVLKAHLPGLPPDRIADLIREIRKLKT
jgi:hypothetical protein